MSEIETLVNSVTSAPDGAARSKIFQSMTPDIRKKVREEVKKRVADSKKAETKPPAESEESDIEWDSISKPPGGVRIEPIVVLESELDELWESMDGDTMADFDDSAASAFDYVGFDPKEVGRQMIIRGRTAGLNSSQIRKDLNTLLSAAHKKGSVNEKNYAKMSKSGQLEYNRLETLYKLKKGGSKGLPSETITVARIGAAFPGRIIRMLQAGKINPKTFQGPLKSHTLPSVMQTQAFAACIPSSLDEVAKDTVLMFARAYGADQSIVLSLEKKKPTAQEAWDKQLNFVSLTRDASYPSDANRKSMFKQIDWAAAYPKTDLCRKTIVSFDNSISFPTLEEFLTLIKKL